jgi:hypothetical protein
MARLLPPDPRDWVPEDHLVRFIEVDRRLIVAACGRAKCRAVTAGRQEADAKRQARSVHFPLRQTHCALRLALGPWLPARGSPPFAGGLRPPAKKSLPSWAKL